MTRAALAPPLVAVMRFGGVAALVAAVRHGDAVRIQDALLIAAAAARCVGTGGFEPPP